jgi:serine/threonine protein kinase
MANHPYEPTEGDTTASDLTVMRGNTGTGSGQAVDTPKVLKQRFMLEAKLGSGGMGTVYRAKDLRKVEARDRDPYLAVKVLNNDFRAHPDAFVALQREASKSQALAHPNIVSIFDFDKDGEIPFMTMELLKGKELGELLNEYPNGLPDGMVWPIIEDVCAGLKRAHDSGITHADFKPGNVFVTDEHGAKILDFGIARAVRGNARFGDDTVFDPSKLAALTPAYASREMLLGDVPQPTDDIYSLAVVVYMLLTGSHPYNRVRADEAERNELRPERIKKLSHRRWWVLARALDFHAENRPQSMDEIIAGLVTRPALKPWMTAVLLVIAVGVGIGLSVGPLSEKRELVARDALLDAQSSRIDELLATPVLDASWQDQVATELARLDEIDDGGAAFLEDRGRVLEVYQGRVAAVPTFDAAIELLRAADALLDGARFEPGYDVLQNHILADLHSLLMADHFDRAWFDDVELQLLRFARVFPRSTLRAELAQQVGEVYLEVIGGLVAANELNLAEELFALTAPRVFDYDDLEQIGSKVEGLRSQVERARVRTVDSEADQRFTADFDAAVGFVCQRLDGNEIDLAVRGLVGRHGDRAAAIRAGVAQRVAQCVVSLAETDQPRAKALRETGVRLLGRQSALVNLTFDPCSMRHLIGAGGSPGGLGVCQDVLTSGAHGDGPDLVVIPDGERRFAIMRQVFRVDELAMYCTANGCDEPEIDVVPAGSVSRADAIAFAAWMTQVTGHRYRLPSSEEWRRAMGGDVASTTTCTGGAARGDQNEFGLSLLSVNSVSAHSAEWLAETNDSSAQSVTACAPTGDGALVATVAQPTGVRLLREVQ